MVWIAEAKVFLDRQCAKNLLKSEKTPSDKFYFGHFIIYCVHTKGGQKNVNPNNKTVHSLDRTHSLDVSITEGEEKNEPESK